LHFTHGKSKPKLRLDAEDPRPETTDRIARPDGQAPDACRRPMSIPGVGQLTALAFTAAIDDPKRFRRSRDIGAYLGLVLRRYQSGEVDYSGSISRIALARRLGIIMHAMLRHGTEFKPA
jgi:transposase